MSKYTTEVRFICESKSGFNEEEIKSKSIDEIIDASKSNIFNFSYPIYDIVHKPILENKILKHYYTREIGAETFGLWQLWLNDKMNVIMPKYNKLYEAEHEILGKELKNIDVHSETLRTDDLAREDDFTRTDNLHQANDYTSTKNLTDTNTHHDSDARKYSDTPQGSITFSEANEEYYWLTDYTETNNNGGYTNTHTGTDRNAGTTDNTGTQRNAGSVLNTGTQTHETDEEGYRGGKIYSELLEAYSQKVINIDMMIIEELKDLFFKLW